MNTKYNLPSKRLWRTLIRVNRHNPHWVTVTIPGYDPQEEVGIKSDSIPEEVKAALRSGQKYLYARVNIGAERTEDLFFQDWEIPEDAYESRSYA